MPLSAAKPIVSGRSVLGHTPKSRVGDSLKDHGSGCSSLVGPIGSDASTPSVACYKGRLRVNQVLAIVQVEHRKPAVRFSVILRWQIHRNGAVVGQNLRVK